MARGFRVLEEAYMNILTPTVGYYKINPSNTNSFNICLYKRPSLINRFFAKILLGWIWVDTK